MESVRDSSVRNPLYASVSLSPDLEARGHGARTPRETDAFLGARPSAAPLDIVSTLKAALMPAAHARDERRAKARIHAAALLQEATDLTVAEPKSQAAGAAWQTLADFCGQKDVSLAAVLDTPSTGVTPLLMLVRGRHQLALRTLARALAAGCDHRPEPIWTVSFAGDRVGFQRSRTSQSCTLGAINEVGQPHGFNVWHKLHPVPACLEGWAGEYAAGRRTGEGSITSEVIEIRGSLDEEQRIEDAFVAFSSPRGKATFTGSVLLLPDGLILREKGEWMAVDGSRSCGTFSGHARGQTFFADGSSYEGDWYLGDELGDPPLATGRGTLRDHEGVYEGMMHGGMRYGQGIQRYLDGSLYKGRWHENLRDGQGQWVQADGNVLIGRFERGQPQDEMRLLQQDGTQATALFIDGRRVSVTGAPAVAQENAPGLALSDQRLQKVERQLGAAALKLVELESALGATRESALQAHLRAERLEALLRAHLKVDVAADADLMA